MKQEFQKLVKFCIDKGVELEKLDLEYLKARFDGKMIFIHMTEYKRELLHGLMAEFEKFTNEQNNSEEIK